MQGDRIPCKSLRCRSRMGHEEHSIEQVELKDYAFGLFLTSRHVSDESRAVFYGGTHFVFDNRFDLHFFLISTRDTAKYIKSVTFNWTKSCGPHTKETKRDFKNWSLQSELCYGPRLSTSIQDLAKYCPSLQHLEMIDTNNIPSKDDKEFELKEFKEWSIIKDICSLGLKSFTYPSFTTLETLYPELQAYHQQRAALKADIEQYVTSSCK